MSQVSASMFFAPYMQKARRDVQVLGVAAGYVKIGRDAQRRIRTNAIGSLCS